MLNYSRALRNDVGVWSKSFLCALLTAPLWEATIGIFSHCTNINFATFQFQTGASPASLNTQHTFSFLVTLLLLPFFFCAFPHSLLCIPSAENRASNIRLEVPPDISRLKNLDKTSCSISALSVHWFQNLKPFCPRMRNYVAFLMINFLQTKLSQLWHKACLALPGTVLYEEKKSTRLIFTCLLGYWKWKIFHSMSDLLSLQHLSLLGQNFYTPPDSMPATNMHCHQPISTYFSYLLNRWEFGSELHLVSQLAQSQAQCHHHTQEPTDLLHLAPSLHW